MISSLTKTNTKQIPALPIIDIRSLSLKYDDKDLIDNLNLLIPASSFVAIVGHNGSGKSTFLRTLAGQASPAKGSINVLGRNLQQYPRKELSNTITYLAQKNPVSFDIRVIDLVVMGLFRYKRFPSTYTSADYETARQQLHSDGIGYLSDQLFGTLSGGEQQLVWLAQLQLHNAPLWLLDEPTQQLDLYNKRQVFEKIIRLTANSKTVICITHDIHMLKNIQNGYFINFSERQPCLKPIAPDAIDQCIEILENPPLSSRII